MDNNRRILEMLAEKKITVEEAEKLMSLMHPGTENEEKKTEVPRKNIKYLRVSIRPSADNPDPHGHGTVNIRVPMALMRAGIKLASLIPPSAYNQMDSALKEKGIQFDMKNISPENLEEIVAALDDLEVDIEDGKQIVRVYAE